MKALLITAALGALAVAGGVQAQTGPQAPAPALRGATVETVAPLTGTEADEALARADAYLNGLQAMKGRFVQINPDGSIIEGDLFLQRPGRMRFEYDAPSPQLIIADGRTVALIDSRLETVDRLLLEDTPLAYLLQSNVDLARDGDVQSVLAGDGQVRISLDDPRDQIPGQLELIFADPEFALREWVSIDQYGQQTRVVLSELTRQASLDPALFRYEYDSGSRRPGQR